MYIKTLNITPEANFVPFSVRVQAAHERSASRERDR
jgi:hypothetical protein